MKKMIREEKGMMTVEVIIGLTIYIIFFVLMMNLLNVIYIKQKFQAAMSPIAVQLSREYAIDATIAEDQAGYEKIMLSELMKRRRQGAIDSVNTGYVSMDNIKYEMILRARDMFFTLTADFKSLGYASSISYADMWIVGGYNGIFFEKTKVNENGSGELELVIEYRIRIANIPLFNNVGIYIPVEQTASTKLWE